MSEINMAVRRRTWADVQREHPAAMSAMKMLLERYEGARCDSQAVSTCVRCNVVFLARWTADAIETGLKTTDLNSSDCCSGFVTQEGRDIHQAIEHEPQNPDSADPLNAQGMADARALYGPQNRTLGDRE